MRMKRALILVCMFATPALAQSSHAVRGYVRSDGTYVAPHVQTNADSTKSNNWSTQGNTNPYTGQNGTVDPYRSTQGNPYATPNNQPRANPYATPNSPPLYKPFGF